MPNTVLVAGTMIDLLEAERRVDRCDTLATGFKKSALYCGAKPCKDFYVNKQTLN